MKLKIDYSITDIFLLLFQFLNKNTTHFNFRLSFQAQQNKSNIVNSDLYYDSGELLMLFYVFNLSNLEPTNIAFSNNTFYFNKQLNLQKTESSITLMTSENIINDIIRKSVYFKESLPKAYLNTSSKDLTYLKNGFENAYNSFITNKMDIIEYLSSLGIKNQYPHLFNKLKILNPQDLSMQLHFIDLKYTNTIPKNIVNRNISIYEDNLNSFFIDNLYYLDLLIKNGIIGSGENGLEIMWLGYLKDTIQPIKEKNIYIALLFVYASRLAKNKYYLESAKNCINPVLQYIKNNIKLYTSESSIIIKLLYALNYMINFDNLNKFIQDNPEPFSLISLNEKKQLENNPDKLITQTITNESFKVLNLLILPSNIY